VNLRNEGGAGYKTTNCDEPGSGFSWPPDETIGAPQAPNSSSLPKLSVTRLHAWRFLPGREWRRALAAQRKPPSKKMRCAARRRQSPFNETAEAASRPPQLLKPSGHFAKLPSRVKQQIWKVANEFNRREIFLRDDYFTRLTVETRRATPAGS
jgi:hypothetical protein